MTSFHLNYLLKAPPANIVTLGLGFNLCAWERPKHSDHNRLQKDMELGIGCYEMIYKKSDDQSPIHSRLSF